MRTKGLDTISVIDIGFFFAKGSADFFPRFAIFVAYDVCHGLDKGGEAIM